MFFCRGLKQNGEKCIYLAKYGFVCGTHIKQFNDYHATISCFTCSYRILDIEDIYVSFDGTTYHKNCLNFQNG